MKLRAIFQEMYDEHGALTPVLVVNTAREPEHPLHSRFEWDDAVAGEQWRLEQARSLIQSVKIRYREGRGKQGPRSVRAYQSVPTETGRAYMASDAVALDPLLRQMVLRDMERDWKTLKERYSRFAEFAEMIRRDLDEDVA